MSELVPTNLTVSDICNMALQESGRIGIGMTAQAEDINKAWARLQFMLQEWERKRWLVYHLVTYSIVATGQTSYSFGPGGQINTNQVAAWGLESLAPLSGYAGTDYEVYDQITLSAQPAAGTPTDDLVVEVSEVDASGGVVAVLLAGHARGFIQFSANPSPGETITLNGVVWTFVAASTGSSTETVIQASGELTVAQLASDLNASTEADLELAMYSATGAIADNDLKLNVVYDDTGAEGNDYTLAASFATPSGSELTLGFTSDVTYPGPLPNSWTQASTTGIGLNVVLGFPVWGLSTSAITQATGSARPQKLESAFLRQIQLSQPNQVDYALDILQSMEDYNKISLKSLQSFPGCIFLDAAWPLANLYCYPVPQADIYSINVTVRQQLPVSFLTVNTPLNLPFEYYGAILYNLAMRLRSVYQIPSYPGDALPGLAKDSLAALRGSNTAIARLGIPTQLVRPGIYNIFSDRNY